MYYRTRRARQLLKLCMICAASSSDELVITVDDFNRALDFLMEAEVYMPEIFKAMAQGGTGKIMEEAWYFLYQLYMKKQEPVLQYKLIEFLKNKVPVHQIMQTVEMMIASKMVDKRLTKGGDALIPRKPNV